MVYEGKQNWVYTQWKGTKTQVKPTTYILNKPDELNQAQLKSAKPTTYVLDACENCGANEWHKSYGVFVCSVCGGTE